MAFWTEDETTRIADAVAAVEATTSGEIVVATVPRSGVYVASRLGFSGAIAVLAAIVVGAFAPNQRTDFLIVVEILAALVAFAIASAPPVLRWLVGSASLDEAVGHRALRAFAEHGIFDTRDRTGVLIFLSELERRAVILGDKGIDRRLGREGWDRLVGELTAALREDQGADGVCRVVAEIGEVLSRELPPRTPNEDELPSRPIRER